MIVLNNILKFILITLVWPSIYGWKVIENNNFIPNIPTKHSKNR